MRKDSLIRVSAVVLAVLTAATIAFAIINFQKENQFSSPEDGAWWKEQSGVLTAQWLTPAVPLKRLASRSAISCSASVPAQPKKNILF